MTDSLASRIDHTNLSPEADAAAIDRLCAEAREHGFASVCLHGRHVARAARQLGGSGVEVGAVVGFPLGGGKSTIKAIEATACCKDGAREIDFVPALDRLIAGDAEAVQVEAAELVRAARAGRRSTVVKMILETAALMRDVDEQEQARRIAAGCEAARASGCDFVKTSTGFHQAGGASEAAVRLLKRHAGELKVKASGGIRTPGQAHRLIEAGADRLGCSGSVAIVRGATA